jgi:hypothetical protein
MLALAEAPGAEAQGPREATCPSTFEVLAHDSIGSLNLLPGPYTITLLDSAALTCADASELFRQFLEDFDGRLSGGWVLNAASATFTRGNSMSLGFRIARASGPPAPPSARVCPSYFSVLHNDHIGTFRIAAGRYRILLLSIGPLNCAQASGFFARFLADYDGVLQRPWFLDPVTGTLTRGNRHLGFRIAPWSGPVPPSNNGGTSPSDGTQCRNVFTVLHNTKIGRLPLRKGRYVITRLKSGRSPSCGAAANLLSQFLQRYNGVLPSPWRLNAQTGTFARGKSNAGFRIKPRS